MIEYNIDKKHILIVDDNLKNLEFIGSILKDNNYNLSLAQSGEKALKIVEKKKPDLILLDINMPEMTGYEVCERLKKCEEYQDIPIIFLSAYNDLENKVKAFEIGGRDYITKPIEKTEMLVRIKTHLTISGLMNKLSDYNNVLENEVALRTKKIVEKNKEMLFLIEKMNGFLYKQDNYGNLTDISSSVKKITGFDEFELQKIDFIKLKERENLDLTEDGNVNDFNVKKIDFFHKDGSKMILEINEKVIFENDKKIGLIGIAIDITQRIKIQELLIQNEKIMSLGGLTAGIAHEIKNPLSGIMQSVQNITRRLDINMQKNIDIARKYNLDLKRVKEYLEERKIYNFLDGIIEGSNRADEIIKNMLDYSRKESREKKLVDINKICEQVIKVISQEYDLSRNYDFKTINLIKDYFENIPPIKCFPQEISQVLFNLLKNAADSMYLAKIDKPEIFLKTELIENYVKIIVKDNGPGVPDKLKNRIFEPFFTTKDSSVGTGLGLSVSYFIIKEKHNGEFTLNHNNTFGAEFIIKLPL